MVSKTHAAIALALLEREIGINFAVVACRSVWTLGRNFPAFTDLTK
jgi:hypothetical protein